MAHFAQLNDNNEVLQIIVIDDLVLLDDDGNESESKGVEYCRKLIGENTRWIQTSYNSNFRKNYAGIGYIYDEIRDIFLLPKPFNSWVLNEQTYDWESPIPYPTDGQEYYWNEDNLDWEILNINT